MKNSDKRYKYINYYKYILFSIVMSHLGCGETTLTFRIDSPSNYKKIILDKNKYHYGLEYKFYSAIFSGEQIVNIDSTNLCPPYRKLYYTIKRPNWSSFLSFVTLTIPFRHTIFILKCE
jgi:hypothetical protein